MRGLRSTPIESPIASTHVVSTSANDCLEAVMSEMICSVLTGMLDCVDKSLPPFNFWYTDTLQSFHKTVRYSADKD